MKKSKFDFLDRLFHWTRVGLILFLTLTGFQIHSARFNVFGAMGTARTIHFFAAWLFVFFGIWHLYRFFVTGIYKTTLPNPFQRQRQKNFFQAIAYYLFLTETRPPLDGVKRFNELQKLTYFMVLAFAFVQIVLGFMLYWPVTFAWFNVLLGGLVWIRYWHYFLSWIFLFFLAIHIYLVFYEGTRLAKEMLGVEEKNGN
ncbi:cytochrome b/b6 domain-containing protein [Candidatus Nomurabacteria bacterium]|nr:cytochrome b/b6 domain-containing protein [Candidatus Nomurabacteria bacterium]